jgi:acetylglutamate kinase
MREYIEKAKVLVEALPYIKEFNGITVVIKYGGSALGNHTVKESLIKDIALMKFVGFKPVVVHGGGAEINAMLNRLQIESQYLNGLRITDEQTMETAEMVLSGKLNKEITTDLSKHGIHSVGISGKDGQTIQVKKYMPNGEDIGFVGKIEKVDTTLIKTLIDSDFVPVISPISADENGVSYNVNADTAAVAIAGALNAEKLVFLTDVVGILRDQTDFSTVYSRLQISKINEMIEQRVITGGMIPKVESCIEAVNSGVQHVHILDGRVEHCLLLEIFTTDGIGTLIER